MSYRIVSKRKDQKTKKFLFTFEGADDIRFERFAEEISQDKTLMHFLDKDEIYDVAYTLGSESVLNDIEVLKNLRKQC